MKNEELKLCVFVSLCSILFETQINADFRRLNNLYLLISLCLRVSVFN